MIRPGDTRAYDHRETPKPNALVLYANVLDTSIRALSIFLILRVAPSQDGLATARVHLSLATSSSSNFSYRSIRRKHRDLLPLARTDLCELFPAYSPFHNILESPREMLLIESLGNMSSRHLRRIPSTWCSFILRQDLSTCARDTAHR